MFNYNYDKLFLNLDLKPKSILFKKKKSKIYVRPNCVT